MLVTQSIENNVNILANSPTAENIISVLQGMPFDYFHCADAVDTFAIEKDSMKPKTLKQIADERWTSEKMTFNFPGPEF